MATARVLPRIQTAQTINFTWNGTTLTVSPQGVIVDINQSIIFANAQSSTAPITIQFLANPPGPYLFGNPPTQISVAAGANKQLTPAAVNGSVNYNVSVNGTQVGGPYAIQNGQSAAGGGPIYIQVSDSSGIAVTIPDTVAVPQGGTVEVKAIDTHSYTISCPSGFTPAFKSDGQEVTATGSAGTYDYSADVKDSPMGGDGGGHIIIVSA